METIRKAGTFILILLAFVGITDEGLFQYWKFANPGQTFATGTIFVAETENAFNPATARVGQSIVFRLATFANRAGSEKSPELPDKTRFIAKVKTIVTDNEQKIVHFEFTAIRTPDGENHPMRAFLIASDSPADTPGIIWRDGEWASLGIATAFMVGTLPAIPFGAAAGYSLSRSSSRHVEAPTSFISSPIERGFLIGIQLNRDHHLPYRRVAKDYLTKIY